MTTTLEVAPPLWPGSTTATVLPNPAEADALMEPNSHAGRRILVVDDNVDAAETLALLLSLYGHEVRTTHDGASGVALAAEFLPELILMDIGMPGMDGYEAATHIRRTEPGRAATLAALTGWGQEEDRRRSREAGFDHHFVKPVDPDDLHTLIASL